MEKLVKIQAKLQHLFLKKGAVYLEKLFSEYPEDIKKKIKKRIFKRVFGLIAMLAIILLFGLEGGFRYFSYPEKRLKAAALFILFIILAVIISGIHKELFDRSWHGKVTSVFVKTTISPPKGGGGKASGRAKWLNTVYAGIYCEDGRVIKKAVLQYFSGAKWFVKIHEGDMVAHYKWCPHTRIDKADGSITTCVMCGAQNKFSEEKCCDCESTLMHVKK